MNKPDPQRPPRVRVRSPHADRPRVRPRRPASMEIDEQTELGSIYLTALLRSQLRLALRTTAVLVVTIGSLPLLFLVFPRLGSLDILGMPLPWTVLAFGCYPVLVAIAWRHLRATERLEQEFVHVVERT